MESVLPEPLNVAGWKLMFEILDKGVNKLTDSAHTNYMKAGGAGISGKEIPKIASTETWEDLFR